MKAAAGRFEDIDPQTRRRLDRFAALLLERNASLNLTAARSAEAVEEHLCDSLTLMAYVRDPLVDIGSGGGFPAIPLAIATGYAVTAIEAVAKKAHFLEASAAELALPLSVVIGRAEETAHRPDLRERFCSATARAIGSFSTVLELTVPFLALGGIAALQRARMEDDEWRAGAHAASLLGAEIIGDSRTATLPDQRRIVLVRKTATTSSRFPRRSGVPAKRPLGTVRLG